MAHYEALPKGRLGECLLSTRRFQAQAKGKEKEINKLVLTLIKKGMKDIVLDRKVEIKLLKENIRNLEKEFKLKVEIIESDSGKALPFKPAILVE